MPTFVFTAPDGKHKYTIKGPDGSTQEQAFAILQQQLAAAPAAPQSAADQVPGGGVAGNRNVGKPDANPDTLLQRVAGVAEPVLTMASGAVAAPVGALAAVGKTIKDGMYGKQDQAAEDFGGRVAQALTYQPRTQTGSEGVAKLADLAERSGIAGLPMSDLGAAGQAIRDFHTSNLGVVGAGRLARDSVLAKAAETNAPINAADAATAAATGPKLADLVRAPSQLSGVGAARASQAAERAQRGANLRVPIKYTEGQLTRDRAQNNFEQEVAKRPEGKKVANHFEDQNKRMHQNLDEMTDETGAQSVDPRDVGKSVVSAIEAKASAKKKVAGDLYKAARTAGETAEHVDVSPLAAWVEKNKGKDKIASIIGTIESEMKQNGKVEGGRLDPLTLTPTPKRTMMTLDGTEDLRQAINKLAEPGTPNAKFGREAQRIIDAATEDKGGPLYRQARRAWENYSKEFTDRGVVSKLLRTKPGSTDRAVALEKVTDHAILSPATSTDDVRHMVRVLTAFPAGTDPAVVEAGQQAMRDLRGAVIDHIKNEITKNVNIDSTGRATASAAKIKGIVSTLDRSGKLEVVFGKQAAQEIRDLRDAALDLYTIPRGGAGNTSGTAQAIIAKLDQIATATSATPLVGKALHWSAKQAEKAYVKGRVNKALNPKLSDLAGKGGD